MALILASSPSDQASLAKYLEEIKKIPSLEAETEFMLAKRMIDYQDIESARKIAISHLKLVPKIARTYKNYGMPMIEMIAEGNIGLLQALKKFNPDLGFRFSTYATWWIKASIQEYILKSWSLVKLGTTTAQKKLFFNLRKMKSAITKLEGRDKLSPSEISNIAHQLDVDEKDVIEMDQRIYNSDISLNNYINNEETAEAIEFIPETRANQELIVSNRQEKNIKHQLLKQALQILDPREREIIEKRHLTESPITLDEIAKQFGISTERVRQLEARALEKLKKNVLNNS